MPISTQASRKTVNPMSAKVIPIDQRRKVQSVAVESTTAQPAANDQLRAARIAKFWTQEMASEQAQVSRVAYARWELGLAQPRLYNLGLLCQAFQMSPEELGFSSSPGSERYSDPRPLLSSLAERKG
jgi:DNA-binding XRE family transcriptional regulator